MKTLSTSKGIDKHLRPIRDADGSPTELEVSTDTIKLKNLIVKGDIEGADGFNFKSNGGVTTTDSRIILTYKAFSASDPQIRIVSSTGNYADIFVSDGGDLTLTTVGEGTTDSDLLLDVDGTCTIDVADGLCYIASTDLLDQGFLFNTIDQSFRIYGNGAATDFLTIDCQANGVSTIATTDAGAGTDGDLILDADGDIKLDATTGQTYIVKDGTNFGWFDTDTGSTLKLSSATNYHLSLHSQGTGDIVLDSNGDITLDSNDGNFIAKKAGTEFSVANSAYAGMILGYRCLGHDAARVSYTITTSFVTLHADATVRFIAPPSGVVEVFVQAGLLDAYQGRYIYFGLSDNATYNTIGAEHEEMVNVTDESDVQVIQNVWVISGLTAGDTYNYWFGVKSSHASSSLSYGGTGSGHYSPFIMKVTALPSATADFAVYD